MSPPAPCCHTSRKSGTPVLHPQSVCNACPKETGACLLLWKPIAAAESNSSEFSVASDAPLLDYQCSNISLLTDLCRLCSRSLQDHLHLSKGNNRSSRRLADSRRPVRRVATACQCSGLREHAAPSGV